MESKVNVKRVSVAELLVKKALKFFIPDYQRGYRWTSQQVEELLQDLLIFAIKEKNTGAYYCLQPLVVRNDTTHNLFEVIDGQQRLTTLKILLHYLKQRHEKNGSMEEEWNILNLNIYEIIYETREKSNDFLERLGHESDKIGMLEPIDFHFMRKAYKTIDDWFGAKNDFKGKGAPYICGCFGEKKTSGWKYIEDCLVNLPSDQYPTVQFLWYEVEENEDSIGLFNRLNTGMLRLTDAELIKGLFLLRSNMSDNADLQVEEQIKMAVQWERIENSLHNDGFWSFLTPCGYDVPNRIDLLFELIYYKALLSNGVEPKDIEQHLQEKQRHAVFNYYNNIFNGEGIQRQKIVAEKWEEISQTFSFLEDWYWDPEIYNLIGFLCHTQTAKLPVIFCEFCKLKEGRKDRKAFVDYIKGLVCGHFEKVKITYSEEESARNYYIDLSYKTNKRQVYDLLLLLNVDHMNKRTLVSNLKPGERELCKFPFAVMAGKWDIEHVDSQTANTLADAKDRKEWVDIAKEDLICRLQPEKYADIFNQSVDLKNDRDFEGLVRKVQAAAEEELCGTEDEGKDNIRNLVLLDATTNRSYQNALYVSKRKKIIKRREEGQYVPETTSYVFFKLFEENAMSKWHWGRSDMQMYANYIVQQLKQYLPSAKKDEL